jgi:hypothetical protein
VVFTGVGFGVGFAVGFALADLLGVGVAAALLGTEVAEGAVLEDPALDVPGLEAPALEAAALETVALDAALETAGKAEEAEEATPLELPGALGSVPSGAA